MIKSMEDMKWGYVTGTTTAFDEYRVRFGKSLSTQGTVTLVKTLSLRKGVDERLYISDGEDMGKTSPIVKEYWLEDFCIGNEQVALVKCFETSSGSKYYFAPMCVL